LSSEILVLRLLEIRHAELVSASIHKIPNQVRNNVLKNFLEFL